MARSRVGAFRSGALARSMPFEAPWPVADALIAGAVAGGLAGLAEAALMQVHGFGARSASSAIVFAAASSEISLPLGALVGLVVHWVRAVLPSEIWRGIDKRLLASWIYGAGVALPLLAAAYFRLFLWLIANFRNLTLAALASAFLSIAAAVSAIGIAGFIASIAQRIADGRWARPGLAILVIAMVWGGVATPGFLAGPDEALRGPFGFVGLLRKDALDFTTPIALGVFALGFGLLG